MKLLSILLLGVCFANMRLCAESDRVREDMRTSISHWEKLELRSKGSEKPSSDYFEFFIWDGETKILQWYLVLLEHNGTATALVRYGYGEKEMEAITVERNRTRFLLNEISQSELFHLPNILPDDGKFMTYANTGAQGFLARSFRRNNTVEVFRWIGTSHPVDKVLDALTEIRKLKPDK